MLRSTLLKLSQSKSFANWVTSNNKTRTMARRFVAGEGLDEALAAARVCNDHGMLVSLDYLGENVSSAADAQRAGRAGLAGVRMQNSSVQRRLQGITGRGVRKEGRRGRELRAADAVFAAERLLPRNSDT